MCSGVLGGAFNVSGLIAAPQLNKYVHCNTRKLNYLYLFIYLLIFTFRLHYINNLEAKGSNILEKLDLAFKVILQLFLALDSIICS